MIVRRILVENAGPFLAEWEVELPEGVTAVVGEYEDAEARSNRAGKSFLAVDGLLYALFGKFRGRADDFVHRGVRGREGAFVEYEIENSEGARFVLRRGRSRSGDPIRYLDGAEVKDADLERVVVEEILGLSYDEFVLTNCFVQDRMHAFMEMPPAEKRRIVSPWFRTDRWVPRADLAGVRLRTARRRLADLEREGRAHEETLEAADVREEIAVEEAELAAAREEVEGVLEERARILAEVDADVERRRARSAAESAVAEAEEEHRLEVKRTERERDDAAARLAWARAELDAANGRADRVKVFLEAAAARDEFRAAADELAAELRGARSERDERSRDRERLLARFAELTESRTGTCPVLLEPCDRVARDEAVVDGVRREGLRVRRAIDRAVRRIGDLEWKLEMTRSDLAGAEEAEREVERLRAGVTVAQAAHEVDLAKRAADAAAAAASDSAMGRSPAGRALVAARKALRRLPEAPGDESTRRLAEIAERRERAERRRDEAERRVAGLVAREEGARRAEARLAEIEGEVDAVRREVENLAWAAYAFGASGIPSRELENAFGVAEDAMNAVLSDLGAPTRLRFSPSRELKDWEAACLGCGEVFAKGERTHVCPECGLARRKRRRDELRLEVVDGAEDASFELDSGGGKVLLSLGGRLGLAQLPGATRRVRCELAVVDEPDGALDPPNRAALHRVLRDRLPALGIRQALLITHADVREEFDSVVVVRRWPDEDRSGFWRD